MYPRSLFAAALFALVWCGPALSQSSSKVKIEEDDDSSTVSGSATARAGEPITRAELDLEVARLAELVARLGPGFTLPREGRGLALWQAWRGCSGLTVPHGYLRVFIDDSGLHAYDLYDYDLGLGEDNGPRRLITAAEANAYEQVLAERKARYEDKGVVNLRLHLEAAPARLVAEVVGDPLLASAYGALHGPAALEALRTVDTTRIPAEGPWIEHHEIQWLRTIARLEKAPPRAEQLAQIREDLARRKRAAEQVQAAQAALASYPADRDHQHRAVDALVAYAAADRSDAHPAKLLFDADQQRLLRGAEALERGVDSSFEYGGLEGARFGGTLRVGPGPAGRMVGKVALRLQTGAVLIEHYRDAVATPLGRELTVSLDDGLADHLVLSGTLHFMSLEQGLDQVARLLGARLVTVDAGRGSFRMARR